MSGELLRGLRACARELAPHLRGYRRLQQPVAATFVVRRKKAESGSSLETNDPHGFDGRSQREDGNGRSAGTGLLAGPVGVFATAKSTGADVTGTQLMVSAVVDA